LLHLRHTRQRHSPAENDEKEKIAGKIFFHLFGCAEWIFAGFFGSNKRSQKNVP
jgi:hypothetical protein